MCDTATSLLLILLKDTNLLECLHDLAVNASGGIGVVRWTRATVAGGAVDLSETTNTNGFAKVDVTGDGGSTNVKPVDRLWWELLCWAGLDGINPTCNVLAFSGTGGEEGESSITAHSYLG